MAGSWMLSAVMDERDVVENETSGVMEKDGTCVGLESRVSEMLA